MAKSSEVVLQRVDSNLFAPPPKADPSNVYVVSYRDGRVQSFTGAPSMIDRHGSRYCYIVDTAEHHVTSTCSVPSRTDPYSFSVEVGAAWRVTNAEAVVRAALTDGNAVVLGYLQDLLWQTGRGFAPQDAAAAEGAARAALSQGRTLEQGITILSVSARFRADARLTDGRVLLDQDTLAGQLEGQKLARLTRLDGSDDSMIREHLLQHPEDTGSVLQMMAASRDRDQSLRLSLLKDLLDRGMITEADMQPFRDALLGGPGTTAALPGGTPLPGARPALSLPPGVTVNGPVPAGPAAALPPGQAAGGPGAAGTPARPRSPQVRSSVVEDADVTAPQRTRVERPESDDPGQPSPDAGGERGGVKGWKPLKKPQGGAGQ